MKKQFIYLLFIIFLVSNCGTRKRVMQKKEERISSIIKKDISRRINKDVTTELQVIKELDKIVFTPIDNEKPFVIAGKKYQNVRIEKRKEKSIDSSKIKDKTVVITTDKTTEKRKVEKKEKNVKVDRDNSFGFFDWFWLILAVLTVFCLIRYRKRIFAYLSQKITPNL